jgi:CRISPR-associated protein Cst1
MYYTNHPYVDIGLATILAFVRKRNPPQLTDADFAQVADYITREYIKQPLRSFLTVVFPNSGFTQPAFFSQPERQLDYAQRVLRSYAANMPTLNEQCVFTGEPAVAIAFGDKEDLPLGRAFRQHIPLLTGEDVINFHPYADAGLPVSGQAMLAIQAFPLGCAKCAGRLLMVHSDNRELMQYFAARFLEQNRKAVQLAQTSGSSKMPEPPFSMRTLFINTLLEAEQMRRDVLDEVRPFSVTVYHLSNSGQGVDLDIYHFPLQVIAFLSDMHRADFSDEWNRIVNRAWEVAPKKKKAKAEDAPFQPGKNWLYEDLFDLQLDLHQNAKRFIRTYFLRFAIRYARGETDPRVMYSLRDESSLVSWKVTAQFLKRILNMNKERVEQIRKMGDQLADYVAGENDRRFFTRFYGARTYYDLRLELIRANTAHVKRGHAPIITLDPYIEVFEEGDELARTDWRLARDLVLIRMVERLHALEWLGKNIDALPETERTDEGNEVERDVSFT